MLAKKIYVTRSFTTRAVFRIAHGHLSRRNNGNKRPGVQVFQVMLCTTWWDAVVRPWISDPNETMMSCLAWLGKDVVKPTIDTNVKHLLCRNFVTLHSNLQRSMHDITVGVFGALTPPGLQEHLRHLRWGGKIKSQATKGEKHRRFDQGSQLREREYLATHFCTCPVLSFKSCKVEGCDGKLHVS